MEHLALNGKWILKQHGKSREIIAQVPGDVVGDLLRTGEIPDPYFRDNENDLQWIGETKWTYQRDFIVPSNPAAEPISAWIRRKESNEVMTSVRVCSMKFLLRSMPVYHRYGRRCEASGEGPGNRPLSSCRAWGAVVHR